MVFYKIIGLSLGLIFWGKAFGQSLTSTVIRVPIETSLRSQGVVTTVFDHKLYFTTITSEKKARMVYILSGEGVVLDSVELFFNGKSSLKGVQFRQIAISHNLVIVLTGSDILFFRIDGKRAKWQKSIKNLYSFRRIEKLDDELLFHVSYSFHPLDQREKDVWAKLDFKELELTDIHIPEITNSMFGSGVNLWVSTYRNIIAHASTTDYKVLFYDNNYVAIDSLISEEEEFKTDVREIGEINLESKSGISDFLSKDASTFSRIRKVFLLDDTHLLILSRLSRPLNPSEVLRLDFWVKNDGKWEITSQLSGDDMYQTGNAYNDSRPFLGRLYQNVHDIIVFDGKLICVSLPYFPKVITESFDREKDIDSYLNNSQRFFYGIEIFNFGTW